MHVEMNIVVYVQLRLYSLQHHLYMQQLYATANMQARQVSMENILKRMEHARLFQDQMEKVRSLGMDLTEHFHIKCIVLFRTGEEV